MIILRSLCSLLTSYWNRDRKTTLNKTTKYKKTAHGEEALRDEPESETGLSDLSDHSELQSSGKQRHLFA